MTGGATWGLSVGGTAFEEKNLSYRGKEVEVGGRESAGGDDESVNGEGVGGGVDGRDGGVIAVGDEMRWSDGASEILQRCEGRPGGDTGGGQRQMLELRSWGQRFAADAGDE